MRTTPKGDGRREFDLDPLRGVLCLWLMGMHLCWMSDAHAPLLRLVPDNLPDLAFRVRLGVESFLVLAGFMAAHMLRPIPGQDIRLGAYFLRRACRLLLPFGIAVLFAAADKWAAYLLFGSAAARPGVLDLLAQILVVNDWVGVREPAVGFWSLATLEQAYLIGLGGLALAYLAAARRGEAAYRTAVARMGPAALAVFVVSGACFLSVAPVRPAILQYSFYIALGFLLYGHVRLGLYRWELPTAVGLVWRAVVLTQNSRLTAALVTAGVLSALARGKAFPGGPLFDALRFVGRRSYSVYLIHAVVGLRLMSGYRFLAGYGDWVAIPFVITVAAVSLVAAGVFYRFVERPCQEMARRIDYRAPFNQADEAIERVGGALAERSSCAVVAADRA